MDDPRAWFMADLKTRLPDRARVRGHAFVTYEEGRYMRQHNLWQPGHSVVRFSTAREDRSDAALDRKVIPPPQHHQRWR